MLSPYPLNPDEGRVGRLCDDITLAASCSESDEVAMCDWVLESGGLMGETRPLGPSACSIEPVHALKTTSRIDGVNRDSVRWESVRAARRSTFLREKRECISTPESRDRDAISDVDRTFPEASTGSWGGFNRGSRPGPSRDGFVTWAEVVSSSLYSVPHSRKESLCIMAGSSSMKRMRSWPSISFWR